jgi:hypothetical protein
VVRVLNSHLCDFIKIQLKVLPIPLQNKFTTIFHFDGKDKNIHLNVSTQYVEPYCFGGVVVSVLATGPKGLPKR